jgi:hypothetical protein
VRGLFVRRLLSRAIEEEWVPPGLSEHDRGRWERLTDDQKEKVRRMYDEFKRYVKELGHGVLYEFMLAVDKKILSEKIGADCNFYYGGPLEEWKIIDTIEKSYEVDGHKTWIAVPVSINRGIRLGLSCYIGKDKDGRDTKVHMDVPLDAVNYAVYVYGDHAAGSDNFYWIIRVKSTEPKVSF